LHGAYVVEKIQFTWSISRRASHDGVNTIAAVEETKLPSSGTTGLLQGIKHSFIIINLDYKDHIEVFPTYSLRNVTCF
jgi:hypothetical protein